MDIETVVAEMKNHEEMPSTVTFYTDKSKNMARAHGFESDRFDSVAITVTNKQIRLMLIMSNRLVYVPKYGYLGVKSFDDVNKAADELVRLTRLR